MSETETPEARHERTAQRVLQAIQANADKWAVERAKVRAAARAAAIKAAEERAAATKAAEERAAVEAEILARFKRRQQRYRQQPQREEQKTPRHGKAPDPKGPTFRYAHTYDFVGEPCPLCDSELRIVKGRPYKRGFLFCGCGYEIEIRAWPGPPKKEIVENALLPEMELPF